MHTCVSERDAMTDRLEGREREGGGMEHLSLDTTKLSIIITERLTNYLMGCKSPCCAFKSVCVRDERECFLYEKGI